jgi:hypothetical protein
MSKNSKKKNATIKRLSTPVRPTIFHTFGDCVKTLKKSVYIIVRGRQVTVEGETVYKWLTLGTGFVAAPYRFVTAAHVIEDAGKDEFYRHKEGDVYYLLRHDDENNWHFNLRPLTLNNDLFLYPEVDLGVIYLSDDFYGSGDQVFADKNDYIRVAQDFLTIGSDIGVLGYPLCQLNFANRDINQPLIGDVLLRTDKGVINCRYKTAKNDFIYEFTLAFNPGNSGGPIFDIKTGKLISIVRGFRTIPISQKEQIINDEASKQLKVYKEKAFIEVANATYSVGFSTQAFVDIFKQHKIIN